MATVRRCHLPFGVAPSYPVAVVGDVTAETRSMRAPWLMAFVLPLPLAGLALLLAQPPLDLEWQHHPSHFWLVLLTALFSVGLAYVTNVAADRRRDARLVLVSLAFLSSAGFLGLHALATPGVLLSHPNTGFTIATPVGLSPRVGVRRGIGQPAGRAVVRRDAAARPALAPYRPARADGRVGRGLAGRPAAAPGPATRRRPSGPSSRLAVGSSSCSCSRAGATSTCIGGGAASSRSPIAVAFVLLAEAMVAVVVSRNWHLSWWEWHLLMLAAFGAIALGARYDYQRSGSLAGTFGGLYSEATLARLDRWHADAIAAVADAEARGGSTDQVLAELRRDGATDAERPLLEEAARELRRLDQLFRPFLPGVVATSVANRRPGAWAARSVRSASCSRIWPASRRSARPARRPRSSRCSTRSGRSSCRPSTGPAASSSTSRAMG